MFISKKIKFFFKKNFLQNHLKLLSFKTENFIFIKKIEIYWLKKIYTDYLNCCFF